MKYVLPIRAQSLTQLEQTIARFDRDYDLFEIWLDYLEETALPHVQDLFVNMGERLILVTRRMHEPTVHLSSQWIALFFELASEHNCWLDLDIESQDELVKQLVRQERRPRTILSFHDFEQTPSQEVLLEKLAFAGRHEATIKKIACHCRTEFDALRLLHLTLELRERNEKCIILGMGEHGAITRVFGTLWGNEMIYAPADLADSTAKGQIRVTDLKKIFEVLKCGANI